MRVQWVHPTWRDLVITQLAGNDQARRRFLQHCGVHGIELALSTQGGDTGARRLPLIGCDADWDAVTDRLFELVSELEPTELLALLATLAQAVRELDGTREADEVRAVAATVLQRVSALWEGRRAPIGLTQLAAWLELAAVLDPRPSPPRLSLTWVELLPVRVPEPGDRAAVDRFADWLVLCELLFEYDPQLKTELEYGQEHISLMAAFLGRAELHTPPGDDQIVRVVDAISRLEPSLQALAYFVSRDVRRAEVIRAREAPAEPEPPPPQLFAVQRILADL